MPIFKKSKKDVKKNAAEEKSNKQAKKKKDSTTMLQEILIKYSNKPIELLLSNEMIRRNIVKYVDKRIKEALLASEEFPQQVQLDKYHLVRNIIEAVSKAFEGSKNAPAVRKALINSFTQNVLIRKMDGDPDSPENNGQYPSFLTISPGKFCNLNCIGCYANSDSKCDVKLDWDILDKIMDEKTNKWKSYFTVISGGEPLLYESKGKNIFDLAKKYPNNYFLIYTNGTLVGKEMAKKFAEVGNITPAISVEGFEKETDARRGKGVHKKVLEAISNLKEAGVPVGISITALNSNADIVSTDEFYDYYFDKLGVTYGWVFQLMPIGRAECLELMVTPQQRLKMYRKVQEMIRDKKYFLADFWNSGCASNGCISGGRSGGYLYIEWNGNLTPCVFNPYAVDNVNDIYKRGDTLTDILNAPFLSDIRKWQDEYALKKKPNEMGNWIIPCAIKDHYDHMLELIKKHKPKPIDEAAQKALEDVEYQEGLKKYGRDLAELIDPVWNKEYLKKE